MVDTPSPLMRRSAALDGSAAAENETKGVASEIGPFPFARQDRAWFEGKPGSPRFDNSRELGFRASLGDLAGHSLSVSTVPTPAALDHLWPEKCSLLGFRRAFDIVGGFSPGSAVGGSGRFYHNDARARQ